MSVTVKSELEVDTKSKIMEPCRSDITKLELEDDEIEDTKQKGPSINDVAIFFLVFLPLSTPHPNLSPLFYYSRHKIRRTENFSSCTIF